MPETVVQVTDLTKELGGETVLSGLDLEIHEGDITLIMGPNGSGKTVLLSCLSGGLRPTDGEISVYGSKPQETRSDFCFMLQGGMCTPALTGRQTGLFFERLHPEATKEWLDIAERFGLTEDALDRQVRDYSGGMKRKLELAVSLGVDTPIYFLDEPSAELDLTTLSDLQALLREKKADGKTIVMTSHQPMDTEIADRIVFVNDGSVTGDGSPDALLERVPKIVRVMSTTDATEIQSHMLGGRLFQSAYDRRGFLTSETDPAELQAEYEVKVESPKPPDMFNYYIHLASESRIGDEPNDAVEQSITNG